MAFKIVLGNYKHVVDEDTGCEFKLDYSNCDRKLLKYKQGRDQREFVIDDYRNGSCGLYIPKSLEDEVYYSMKEALYVLGFTRDINFSYCIR